MVDIDTCTINIPRSPFFKELTEDSPYRGVSLHWRNDGRDSVSNHQPHDCLLNRLFRRRSKKISKFRVTGLCAGNSPETGEFPAQKASNAENVSIWWRHHVNNRYGVSLLSVMSSKSDWSFTFLIILPWAILDYNGPWYIESQWQFRWFWIDMSQVIFLGCNQDSKLEGLYFCDFRWQIWYFVS